MTRVAVTGGTGMIGRAVCTALEARGHEVRVLSRHSVSHPVDLTTGEGLEAALDGCEVVVDASNGFGAKAGRAVLVDGSRRLLEVEQAVGVAHHVAMSIVGCDAVPGYPYYRVKVAQEQVVRAGGVPWTIVRATQFHGFLDMLLGAAAKVGVRPSLAIPLQPVDVGDVALAIADVVAGDGGGRTIEVVGPEVTTVRDLARSWSAATGRGRVPIRLPLWGGMLRALAGGAALSDDPDVRGSVTFESWLTATYA
ncbi:SDR family oxidoreductase [Mumia sp. DW29H23]|uniref:SDR family oxidoreductase n=1 Tax=Mumia sp. DW29H23 TaxID=3421241 RepID=UPI003D6886D5